MSERNAPSREFFLAELEHFEESIWRNEEVGEKRFNFFMTLVTAVAGGLIVLWTSDKVSDDIGDRLPTLTWQACLALLLFGLVSYRRMIHRDRVTAEYKQTTNYIRDKYREAFRDECEELKDYELPLERQNRTRKDEPKWVKRARRIGQAGYTPTLAVLNGVLLVAVLASATRLQNAWSVSLGLLLAVVLCFIGSRSYKEI